MESLYDQGDGDTSHDDHAYCPTCDEDRPIKRTVPWQSDLCTVCGADIDLRTTDRIAFPLLVFVTDSDGEPIPDATVRVETMRFSSRARVEGTTDADGEFNSLLVNGAYTVTVTAEGYETTKHTIMVDGKTTEFPLVLERNEYPLRMMVTDSDGDPVSDATVLVTRSNGTTDTDGRFETTLEQGEYTIVVATDDHGTVQKRVIIGDDSDQGVTTEDTIIESSPRQ